MIKYIMDDKKNIIRRQTDMSDEKIEEKLEEFKGDIEKVIKDYMCPKKVEQKQDKQTKNQLRYKLIREMMDNASKNYLEKKE